MATSSAYYINSLDFSTATAVYLDITLQTKASDGYYSFDGSVRRQVSGLLNSIMVCPTGTLSNYFTLNYDTTCLAACTAPVPVVNCVVSDWSACVNGIQTKSVITPASGGGTACPAVLSQSCTVPPVVNCVVSDWSACVNGIQTKSVITPASGGGTACPDVLTQPCTVINCSFIVDAEEIPTPPSPEPTEQLTKVNFTSEIEYTPSSRTGYGIDFVNDRITNVSASVNGTRQWKSLTFAIIPSVSGVSYKVIIHKNGSPFYDSGTLTSIAGTGFAYQVEYITVLQNMSATNDYYEFYITKTSTTVFSFTTTTNSRCQYFSSPRVSTFIQSKFLSASQSIT